MLRDRRGLREPCEVRGPSLGAGEAVLLRDRRWLRESTLDAGDVAMLRGWCELHELSLGTGDVAMLRGTCRVCEPSLGTEDAARLLRNSRGFARWATARSSPRLRSRRTETTAAPGRGRSTASDTFRSTANGPASRRTLERPHGQTNTTRATLAQHTHNSLVVPSTRATLAHSHTTRWLCLRSRVVSSHNHLPLRPPEHKATPQCPSLFISQP